MAALGDSEYHIAFEDSGSRMIPWNSSMKRTVIRVWPDDRAGMEWAVSHVGSGGGKSVFEIRNLRSQLCLQPWDGETKVGQRIEQAECDGERRQQWHITHVGGPAFQIIPLDNTYLAITPEVPSASGSFLRLGYRNPIDPDYSWDFRPMVEAF
nr:RICIN domain-containing protein [Nocardiopsis mwathae]